MEELLHFNSNPCHKNDEGLDSFDIATLNHDEYAVQLLTNYDCYLVWIQDLIDKKCNMEDLKIHHLAGKDNPKRLEGDKTERT